MNNSGKIYKDFHFEIPNDFKVYHFDLYRIKSIQELIEIDFIDYIYSGNYCFIEWPEICKDLIDINFKEISTSQLDLILRNAQSQGLNQFDLLQIAKSQGLSNSEIEILNKKITSAKNKSYVAENASTPLEDTRMRKQWEEQMEVFREMESDVYGYEIFRGNTFLSFQSNLNIPTPSDYVLGPGDKLFIDIYGQSENYYQAEVSPDGDLILEKFDLHPDDVRGAIMGESGEDIKLTLNSILINEFPLNTTLLISYPVASSQLLLESPRSEVNPEFLTVNVDFVTGI